MVVSCCLALQGAACGSIRMALATNFNLINDKFPKLKSAQKLAAWKLIKFSLPFLSHANFATGAVSLKESQTRNTVNRILYRFSTWRMQSLIRLHYVEDHCHGKHNKLKTQQNTPKQKDNPIKKQNERKPPNQKQARPINSIILQKTVQRSSEI